ncbi:unnamed protein product [Caretta caretta]
MVMTHLELVDNKACWTLTSLFKNKILANVAATLKPTQRDADKHLETRSKLRGEGLNPGWDWKQSRRDRRDQNTGTWENLKETVKVHE